MSTKCCLRTTWIVKTVRYTGSGVSAQGLRVEVNGSTVEASELSVISCVSAVNK